jgi:regulator of sigma E protease
VDLITNALIPFFIILLGLIVLHEAGHYFTAKLFGVKVLEAGIGLPPKIAGFRWRDTDYTLNAIPIGAFVRMLGEEDPSDPQSLAAQVKWKRIIIIGSGAFLNLIAAVVLFSVSLMVPQEVSAGGAVITEVIPNSPAEKAGLQAGDQIVEVNGREADSGQRAIYLVRLYQGSDIDFTVRRTDPRTGTQDVVVEDVYARWDPPPYTDECGVEQRQGPTGVSLGIRYGQPVPFTAEEKAELQRLNRESLVEYRKQLPQDAPETCGDGRDFGFVPLNTNQCNDLDPQDRAAAVALKNELFPNSTADCYRFDPGQGFEPFTRTHQEPPWEAFPNGTRLAFESLILTRNAIWSFFRGFDNGGVTTFAGPVGIAQATGEVVEAGGWLPLISVAASLSMSLAILNFLPLPMVDGGRLFFIFLEFIRGGKRVDPQKEALVHLAGFCALIVFALVLTYFDLARWIGGDSFLQ